MTVVPPPGRFHGNHAIVIGASISGLLAARVLSAHFDRVTVYDRDTLPLTVENRRAVRLEIGESRRALRDEVSQLVDRPDDIRARGAELVRRGDRDHLDGEVTAQTAPQADLPFSGTDGAFERIDRQIHALS